LTDLPLKYSLQETSARDWSKSGPNVGSGPQNKVQQQANARGRSSVVAGNTLDHWDHNLCYHNCHVDHLCYQYGISRNHPPLSLFHLPWHFGRSRELTLFPLGF
jgi:hypothetical protein